MFFCFLNTHVALDTNLAEMQQSWDGMYPVLILNILWDKSLYWTDTASCIVCDLFVKRLRS